MRSRIPAVRLLAGVLLIGSALAVAILGTNAFAKGSSQRINHAPPDSLRSLMNERGTIVSIGKNSLTLTLTTASHAHMPTPGAIAFSGVVTVQGALARRAFTKAVLGARAIALGTLQSDGSLLATSLTIETAPKNRKNVLTHSSQTFSSSEPSHNLSAPIFSPPIPPGNISPPVTVDTVNTPPSVDIASSTDSEETASTTDSDVASTTEDTDATSSDATLPSSDTDAGTSTDQTASDGS